MSSIPNNLAIAFINLTLEKRRIFLEKILPDLNPSEKWFLERSLATQRYFFDIVGRLPIELIIQIFEYLTPVHLLRCRQVCKRWRHILCSADVFASAVRKNFPHDALRLEGSINFGKSWRWIFENSFSRMRNYIRNRPSLTLSFGFDGLARTKSVNPGFPGSISFYDRLVAYTYCYGEDTRSVVVTDLSGQPKKRLSTKQREIISVVFLLKDYVVCVPKSRTATLITFDLETGHSTTTYLTFHIYRDNKYAVDENTLVISMIYKPLIMYDAAATTNNLIYSQKPCIDFPFTKHFDHCVVVHAASKRAIFFYLSIFDFAAPFVQKKILSTETGMEIVESEHIDLNPNLIIKLSADEESCRIFPGNTRCGQDLYRVFTTLWMGPQSADRSLLLSIFYNPVEDRLFHQRIIPRGEVAELLNENLLRAYVSIYDSTIRFSMETAPKRSICYYDFIASGIPIDTAPSLYDDAHFRFRQRSYARQVHIVESDTTMVEMVRDETDRAPWGRQFLVLNYKGSCEVDLANSNPPQVQP
jgi:hypothetical protein